MAISILIFRGLNLVFLFIIHTTALVLKVQNRVRGLHVIRRDLPDEFTYLSLRRALFTVWGLLLYTFEAQ